jgi:formate dehydrogenase accessory protein FdhE
MTGRRTFWADCIRRAEGLAGEDGPARSLLAFYTRILTEQRSMYESFVRQPPSGSADIDAIIVARRAAHFLQAFADSDDENLSAEARSLASDERTVEQALRDYWLTRSDRRFFAKALTQPYARWRSELEAGTRSGPSEARRCPQCNGAPQAAVLETGDGGPRHLLCATCLALWPCRRVVCPACGEEREQQLAYFQSPDFEHVRIDACESCGRYLKTIDRGRLGLAVPLVDEVAAVALDIWAREHGYEKIELNLVGL